MTSIDIISGFSGSGKTTLIQRLLDNFYHDKQVSIIQNESGTVKLNNTDKVQVTSILNGCLCCSNTREFEMTMRTILQSGNYERVMIEPSGMTQLSDLLFLVREQIRSVGGTIAHAATVVDAKRFDLRMKISERFFEHQLQNSSLIFLSNSEQLSEEEVTRIRERILQLNPDCSFLEQNLGNWAESESSNPKTALPFPNPSAQAYAKRIQPHGYRSAPSIRPQTNKGLQIPAFGEEG